MLEIVSLTTKSRLPIHLWASIIGKNKRFSWGDKVFMPSNDIMGLQALAQGIRVWNGRKIPNENNAIQLNNVLDVDNSYLRSRTTEFRPVHKLSHLLQRR